jgi:Fic family protein
MENRFIKRIKINKEILSKIAKIDEFKGLWHGGLRLSPQILGQLKLSVIITSTGASTRIEGSKMTDEEVDRLLKGLKSKSPQGRDAEEVAGYADLLGRVFDNFKTLKLTEGQILQFHKILLNFSKKDLNHKGKYKSQDNVVVTKDKEGKIIVLFRPTPPYLVKKEMDDVLFWVNQELEKKEIHPLLIIANFIFEFLAIHPFEDGNGRLSRALTNLLLLKSGYSYIPYISLEEIIEDHKTDYYLSLRITQKNHKTKNEDITLWLNFLLDALLLQAQKSKEIMDSEKSEKFLSEKQSTIYKLFESDKTLSVLEVDKKLKNKIPKVTIKQALRKLVDMKLIEKIGQGRATRYKSEK